jgi:hypothetical protein
MRRSDWASVVGSLIVRARLSIARCIAWRIQ